MFMRNRPRVVTVVAILLLSKAGFATTVSSDFEDGTDQGWTFVGDVDSFTIEGGGPVGSALYLEFSDLGTGATMQAVAPAPFLGDWTPYEDDGALSADVALLALPGGTITLPLRFEISGPGGTARAVFGEPPIGGWGHYRVEIRESDWQMTSGTWAALLPNVTQFLINTEYGSGFDVVGLDNVKLSDDFSIGWHTVDGGGDLDSSGGDFGLNGSIGQPDASQVDMTGGDFAVAGGFWAQVNTVCPCPADMNTDGSINGEDIQMFVDCFMTGSGNCTCADVNAVPGLDLGDVSGFVNELLSGSACP